MIVVFKKKNMDVTNVESRIIETNQLSRDSHVARNSGVKGNIGRDRVRSLGRRVIHREIHRGFRILLRSTSRSVIT